MIIKKIYHYIFDLPKAIGFFGVKNGFKRVFCGEKAYKTIFSELDKDREYISPTKKNDFVFTAWWQGLDNAPSIVKMCINRMRLYFDNLIIIDENNYSDYIEISQTIMEDFKNNKIHIQQLMDLIRFKLLEKYGGVWFDSTILIVNDPNKYNIFDYQLYSAHTVYGKKWEHYHNGRLSSFFLASNESNSYFFQRCSFLFEQFLLKYKGVYDYLTIDALFYYLYNFDEKCKKIIDLIPHNNPYEYIHLLDNNLSKEYDELAFEKMKKECFIQKTNYKSNQPYTFDNKLTYYGFIAQKYASVVESAEKLSVIVPVYNDGESIITTIESILNQTYKNIEVVVVDDGSTDDTLEKLKSCVDERLFIYSKDNGGPISAYVYGINKSTGNYIAFVDGDDIISPFMYETMMKHMNCDVDSVICDFYNFEPNNVTLKSFNVYGKYKISDNYISAPNKHFMPSVRWNKIYHTEKVKNMIKDFDFSIRTTEDVLFTYSYFNPNSLIYYVKEPLYFYRQVSSGLGKSFNSNILDSINKVFDNLFNKYDKEYIKSSYLEVIIYLLGLIRNSKINFKEKLIYVKKIKKENKYKDIIYSAKYETFTMKQKIKKILVMKLTYLYVLI